MIKVLCEILQDIKDYNEIDKEQFMIQCVQNRLNKSLEVYYHELNTTIKNLNGKNSLRVSKNLNKV